MGKIKVWIKEPNKIPRHVWISNTLKSLQDAVEGYIENYYLTSEVGIICNEEALIYDMKYNCEIEGQKFFGPIVFVGYAVDEFASCPMELADMKKNYPSLWRV